MDLSIPSWLPKQWRWAAEGAPDTAAAREELAMCLCIVTRLGILDDEVDGFWGDLGGDLSPFHY